ncbi:hypothetical protein BWI17_19515 [Betaproteobacteria bacterium GR16-43]|nr:hypothetical protein BWI17_19515 [Betaproteobacteria bacterium GR16-43]
MPQLTGPRRTMYPRFAWVLGAGASYDHGYPLVAEFLSDRYFRWLCDQCVALPASYMGPHNSLDRFLAAVDRYAAISGNFEEVLSTLHAKDGYEEVVSFVYDALVAASQITLLRQMGSTAEYAGLAALMLEQPTTSDTTVISFNYDTSVEDALAALSGHLERRLPPERLRFNYGFERVLDAVPSRTINWASHLPVAYPRGRVTVLKLHGSVNLMWCDACEAVVYFPYQAITKGPAETYRRCPACSSEPGRLIVPPGKRKQVPRALDSLWKMADARLKACDVAVILGYSVPSYDLEARELLGHSLRGKFVLLVDPNPGADTLAFFGAIPGCELRVLRTTASSFLRDELNSYDPRLLPTFQPLCAPAYLNPGALQGHARR